MKDKYYEKSTLKKNVIANPVDNYVYNRLNVLL